MPNPDKGKIPIEEVFEVDFAEFTEQQIQAIELLSLPGKGGLTFEQIAEKVGISVRTLHRWRDKRNFQKAVTLRAIQNIHHELPEVFTAHIKSCKRGNVRAIELLYKLLGFLIDRQEVNQTVENRTQDNKDIEKDIDRLERLLDEDDKDNKEKPGKVH